MTDDYSNQQTPPTEVGIARTTAGALVGRPVVAFEVGQRVGTVNDVFVSADGKQVSHIELAYGQGDLIPRLLDYDAVRRVGRDLVFLHRLPKKLTAQGTALADEVPEKPEDGTPVPDDLLSMQELHELEVLSDDGRIVGHVRDVTFDVYGGEIQEYVVTSGRIQDFIQGEFHVPLDAVEVFGRDYVILADNALDLIKQGKPGMRDTVDELRGRLEGVMDDTLTQGRSLLDTVRKGMKDSRGPELVKDNMGKVMTRLSKAGETLTDTWQAWQRKARGAREEAEDFVTEREVDFLIGKTAGRTVKSEDGRIIIEEGDVINEPVIEFARTEKRLYPLFLSAAMSEVREQLQELQETADDFNEDVENPPTF